MGKIVALVGTLDTKGVEYAYVQELIRARGHQTLVIDAGVLGPAGITPDVSREEVAEAAGRDFGALAAKKDRGEAVAVMAAGIATLLPILHAQGRFHGVMALGGTGGSSIACAGMRALPYGVPKLMVSTVAGGNVSAYVGVKDIVMMPSVVDVAGLNRISREVLARAAGAICGMLEIEFPSAQERPLVVASMFGNTTRAVEQAKAILEQEGYEVLVFHATGTGGRTLEGLVEAGLIEGVLDITTTELADELLGGVMSAGPTRLEAAARRGVPAVVAPGCLDMVNFHAPETVPAKFKNRTLYKHNPNVTLMRTSVEDNRRLGEIVAGKLNQSTALVTVLIPRKGFSVIGAPGGAFSLPDADRAFVEALRRNLRTGIEMVNLDCNINDPEFAQLCARTLLRHMQEKKRTSL